MKKSRTITIFCIYSFALLCTCVNSTVYCQNKEAKITTIHTKGISISLGLNVPIGDFSSTHIAGIAADCSPTRFLYGIKSTKKLFFTYNGGIAYYLGKEEAVSGYAYDYPGYLFIHAFGGVLYNPIKNGSITLTAGPALGIYNSNTQFNLGSRLEFSYYISKNIAIGPGIILMKESEANPIWVASFKATLNFTKKAH